MWTILEDDVTCGYCGSAIAAGLEVWHMRALPHIMRCRHCASEPVDEGAIAAAREGIEQRHAAARDLGISYTAAEALATMGRAAMRPSFAQEFRDRVRSELAKQRRRA